MSETEQTPMQLALGEARTAAGRGEVPVGAVIVDAASGKLVAAAGNLTEELNDPTAHAEMLAIRAATDSQGTPRLENCHMYVTLEPCAMCAAAISLARLGRLYFGAYDAKSGGVEHGAKVFSHDTCHHKPQVIGGVNETEAAALLQDFFRERR